MGYSWQSAEKRSDQWNQGFDAVGYSGRKWAKTAGLSYESSALPLSYSGMGTAAVRREEILRSRADAKYIFSGAWPCEAC